MAALDHAGQGRFDTRLPETGPAELARLAQAFNGMAGQLDHAVSENVRLTQQQAVARAITERLEADRRAIARELHDEPGQSITAVAALAGAIVQRCTDNPAVSKSAEVIRDVASRMHDDVRALLTRLRPPTAGGNEETLADAAATSPHGRAATRTSSCRPSFSPAPIRCPTTSPSPPSGWCRSQAPTSSATPRPAASGVRLLREESGSWWSRCPTTAAASSPPQARPASASPECASGSPRWTASSTSPAPTAAAPASAPACPCPPVAAAADATTRPAPEPALS